MSTEPTHQPLRGARILLAEDNALLATIASSTLTEAGYEVHIVPDGDVALISLRETRFDLLITDWVMPGCDGLTLCRLVREMPELTGLYVIFLTSLDRKDQIVDALSAGADDYLSKPYDAAELLARVRAGLRVVELQAELIAANRALSELARTDALTGLPNRRAMEDLLVLEAARQARTAVPTCLAMVDVDHFKQVNDTYGHQIGDEILVAVARSLRTASRDADVVGRMGGEEFAVILSGCPFDEAPGACERMRSAVSEVRVTAPAGAVTVTASFGVAALHVGVDPAEALEAADAALYRAKREGRNRVGLAQPAFV